MDHQERIEYQKRLLSARETCIQAKLCNAKEAQDTPPETIIALAQEIEQEAFEIGG